MTTFDRSRFTFIADFEQDPRLGHCGANALLVYAASLHLGIEDMEEFAAVALTDGPNDKKVDLCYVGVEERKAVIAQGYMAENWGKAAAPADKASDLNTGVTWLLSANSDAIPPTIALKARELREVIRAGDLDRIELLYVHNCYSSNNVEEELKAAAQATKDILTSFEETSVSVGFRELGLEEIEEAYRARDREILVEERLTIPGAVLGREESPDWKAIVISVGGEVLWNLHARYGDKLFSANYRDFMGMTKRRGNINAGIKQTAASEPGNFWVYNNGITALTHKIEAAPVDVEGGVRVRGISIINGAQTTGAMGECPKEEALRAKVLCRIVECSTPEIVGKIIRYNNTQNAIRPADTRSNDAVQKRLAKEFDDLGITYVHRRSTIRTPRNAISIEGVGPALCAFHGDPQTASRRRSDIFENDGTYSKIFPGDITLEHVYMIHTLAAAFDRAKLQLKRLEAEDAATEMQRKQYEVLKYSMSKHFALCALGHAAEELVGGRVTDLRGWKCRRALVTSDGQEMCDCWTKVLQATLPHLAVCAARVGDVYDVVRSAKLTDDAVGGFTATLASFQEAMGEQFKCLRDATTW